jgi:hypothetical protein
MPGVPWELIKHSLDVSKTTKPIKQKLQRFAQDKKEAIRVEVNQLLAVGFIKEVYHLKWLVNPVLVRKKNNKWKMCFDYTDLNKHNPKDQISLREEDHIKTSFITPFGAYCYMTMSFGLKNTGATYQRAIQ